MKTTCRLNKTLLEITYTFIDDDEMRHPYVEIDDISLHGHSIDVRRLQQDGVDLAEYLSKVLVNMTINGEP